jgi:putative transposase
LECTDEEIRILAIKCYIEGEKQVDIYESLGKSKSWLKKWIKRYRTGSEEWYKDHSKRPHTSNNKIDGRVEAVVINVRESLMDGRDESTKYGFVGAESIQFHMEKLNYDSTTIPSQSTIKRIIRRNNLRVNKKERYKRIKSKGRYSLIKPEKIDEMHQIDFVGPRHIKGYGPINSLHLKDVIGRKAAGNQYAGKSMDNVIEFLLRYWKSHQIPRYIQVDNGMSFAGDFIHPRSISRFVKLCLFFGIEVIFIAPAKPWMNGTIEEFNKGFDRLFWKAELFTSLTDIRKKFKLFLESQNKFNSWKLETKELESITPKRNLKRGFKLDLNEIPLVNGKIHFIRVVNSDGNITVLNESFLVGVEYVGEYVWVTIDTGQQILNICYKDENMDIHAIKKYEYKID